MGGYNTFCEILSFDKRALIVPRHTPRLEQTIRAEAAQRLGLARMLAEPRDGALPDIGAMVRALKALPQQAVAVAARRRRGCSTGWRRSLPSAASGSGANRRRHRREHGGSRQLAIVVKGFPRLSETFVARELAGAWRRADLRFRCMRCASPGSDAALVDEQRARRAALSAGIFARGAGARVRRGDARAPDAGIWRGVACVSRRSCVGVCARAGAAVRSGVRAGLRDARERAPHPCAFRAQPGVGCALCGD